MANAKGRQALTEEQQEQRKKDDIQMNEFLKLLLIRLHTTQKEFDTMLGNEKGAFSARIKRGAGNTIFSLANISRAIGGSVTITIKNKDGETVTETTLK